MARAERYLIAYDIKHPRRLRRVHAFLAKRATAVQYSVFVAMLTPTRRDALARGLVRRIERRVDDVRLYPLPPSVRIEQLGSAAVGEDVLPLGPLTALLGSSRDTSAPSKR